jgi:hypothetical protein
MKRLLVAVLVCAPVLVMAQAQPLVTIGGDRGIELGVILDVTVFAGHLVILDKNAPHLRLLSETGQLVQTTGRSGSGPGEFAVPWALFLDSSAKAVFVVDPANARITEYALDDTLRLTRTISTSVVNLRDVCVLRGRYFGNSGSRTQLLDELELRDGRLVPRRPLGKPQSGHPLASHPMVVGRTSEGPLLCDGSGFIWVASRYLGEIHRVSSDGAIQETVAVRDFPGIRLTAGSGGSLVFSAPDDGWYEEISGLVPQGRGVRVVLTRFTRDGSVRGYQFVDVATDLTSQTARHAANWREIAATNRGVVCVVNDPLPTLAVFSGTMCP